MLQGTLTYFEQVRHFGFIECRIPAPEGGFWLKKYYLAPTAIQFCGTDNIEPGCYVEFEPSSRPPRDPSKDLPFASNVFIYQDKQQAEGIKTLLAAKPQTGVQS